MVIVFLLSEIVIVLIVFNQNCRMYISINFEVIIIFGGCVARRRYGATGGKRAFDGGPRRGREEKSAGRCRGGPILRCHRSIVCCASGP